DGMFVGQDLYSGSAFVYDPWVLYARGLITAPNVVVAGIVGSGKSSLAKSLCTRSIPFGRRVYVACDPKGEWKGVAGVLFHRGGHGEQLIGVDALGVDVGDAGFAVGEGRSCRRRRRARRPAGAALDNDANAGRARHAAHECHRG